LRYLLDTHTLLWSIINPHPLSKTALKLLQDDANSFLVSAASAWEIATKVRLGKLPGAEALELDFLPEMQRLGYALLSIEAAIALRAGRFTASHGDPFDRIIAAQALDLDIPIISIDAKLDAFGIRRIW